MRIKIYLNARRDIELIALRFNPGLDFGGIAREVLRSHVRNEHYSIPDAKTDKYIKRSLSCYVSLNEEEDADVIEYLNKIIVSKSTFIRNIMLRSIHDDIKSIYTDETLDAIITTYDLEKKRQRAKKNLQRKMETRVSNE